MPQKQKLSIEEKVKIVQGYLEGTINKSEAARRGGVARDTIEQWVRNYEADERKTKHRVPDQNKHKLSDSSTSCIWQKWRMFC